eukprot:9333778-Alexandrium_andersonii.AAC.1
MSASLVGSEMCIRDRSCDTSATMPREQAVGGKAPPRPLQQWDSVEGDFPNRRASLGWFQRGCEHASALGSPA